MNYPKPVDPIRPRNEALQLWASKPHLAQVNIADGEPPMPAPWRAGLKLEGCTMFVHPANERAVNARLRALPIGTV